MKAVNIRLHTAMPTAMAENTANFQRQVNNGAPISFNRVEMPSEEHEEMNKMAHDVSETLRYENTKLWKNTTNLLYSVVIPQLYFDFPLMSR